MGVGLNRRESRKGKITRQFPLAFIEIMVPGNAGLPVPLVRILLGGMFRWKPCG